jgi:hypothetical protein
MRAKLGHSLCREMILRVCAPHPEEHRGAMRLEGCGSGVCGLMVRDGLRPPHHEGLGMRDAPPCLDQYVNNHISRK